jgi:MoxR-like ATPase
VHDGGDANRPELIPAPRGEPEEETRVRPVHSAQDLSARLQAECYLADEGLATVGLLALRLHRPLLHEGEPGTGKTAFAEALSRALEVPLIRLQCYEGIDASQALYDWDFARQILYLRAMEATRSDAGGAGTQDAGSLTRSLFTEDFLVSRPVLRALKEAPAVLLIDEVDRADDEFEAFLLEVLSAYQVTIPELGTIRAAEPPVVVMTSNRTRELHDALRRRCLFHWIDHPDLDREIAIVRARFPEGAAGLSAQVATMVQRLRTDWALAKPPGVAESVDWARALHALGATGVDRRSASMTLGSLLKHREDADKVRGSLDQLLAG